MLPAVETLQLLADQVQRFYPGMDPSCMTGARFAKFLEIDPQAPRLPLYCDLALLPNGLRAALISKVKARSAGLSRSVVHAEVLFTSRAASCAVLPLDLAGSLTGICTTIEPSLVYSELVPFGPGYHSLTAPVVLSLEGALAQVRAPLGMERAGSLGSPFPLDGAFHASCAWGQRYANRVAFPVGFDTRIIFEPTCSGEDYFVRIVPLPAETQALLFDLWLFDRRGAMREAVLGLRMQDVSHGDWMPPAWVVEEQQSALPGGKVWWSKACAGVVILERTAVSPLAELGLSTAETQRASGMGPKRRNGFISARMACKRLWRLLADGDSHTPSQSLETIVHGQPQPRVAVPGEAAAYHCSVSHDDRFVVAVAGKAPIGVDVEQITPRALQAGSLFLSGAEKILLDHAALYRMEAALRIWSIKECAAKALGMNLADAWRRVEVVALGAEQSRLCIDHGTWAQALHGELQGHLFTLVSGWE